MKTFARLSMVALICAATLGSVVPQAAIAGSDTTGGAGAEASSNLSIDFTPGSDGGAGGGDVGTGSGTSDGDADKTASAIAANSQVATAITAAISNAVAALSGGGTLTIGSNTITIDADTVSIIEQAINSESFGSTSPANAPSVQTTLEQQITAELALVGVTGVDVSAMAAAITGLSLSPTALPEAIEAVNNLIKSASRRQLIALAQSPSVVAIVNILRSGNAEL